MSRLLSTGLPPLVGTSPLTSAMAMRLGLRYEGAVFPFTRSKDLKEKLADQDKAVVAHGSRRLINVRTLLRRCGVLCVRVGYCIVSLRQRLVVLLHAWDACCSE